MKKTILFLSVLATLSPSISIARNCAAIEYSQIKDMPVEQLRLDLESLNKAYESRMEYVKKYGDSKSPVVSGTILDEAGSCLAEIEKIKTAISAKEKEKGKRIKK